jgi:hypothetical protein
MRPRSAFETALKRTGWVILFMWALALAGACEAAAARSAAAAEPIQSFYGVYKGKSISVSDAELSKRDLAIEVVPHGRGFNLTWTTITYAEHNVPVRKTYSIDFVPTQRKGIYASAMRTDMFGHRVPLNPLEGDLFVWATLRGKTLSVYALMITLEGGYEMQTYHRTLTDDGMHLEFSRLRDGVPLRSITGTLARVR